jgi:hypothetical protein
MLNRVISGGQTGADQAGWRAARRFGIETGGWMPRGYLTEDGPRPEFAELYGAVQHARAEYPPRTRTNILGSDATFLFDTSDSGSLEGMSRGTRLAARILMEAEKPSVIIATRLAEPPAPKRPDRFVAWLTERDVGTLNVAGNRESKAPGIGAWVEEYLAAVFRALGFREG